MINWYNFLEVNLENPKRDLLEAIQWVQTLHILLWYVFTTDQYHFPAILEKTDLSDGFYQLNLTPYIALKLSNPFPNH